MKRIATLSALMALLACAALPAAEGPAAEQPAAEQPAADVKLEPLFNGTDLTGWKAPKDNKWWKVVDGALVGESDEKLRGSMLYSERTFKDAIVQVDFRFDGEIDSGVMLRKPEIQFQIGVSRSLKKDMTASIYAHGKYPGQAQGVDKLLKVGDWNTMRMEARGDVFKVWLNGQHVLTYQDPAFKGAGPIGLQVHGGVKMKVEFRNIQAKALE